MSFFSSQSSINVRAPRLELITEDGGSYVQVQSWGNIEGLRLLSMDRLIVHKFNELGFDPDYRSGELVLLRPKQYGVLSLGRVYGEHILMEPFGKVASMDRWSIVGAILAVERDTGNGSSLDRHAYVGLYKAPKHYEAHIDGDNICEPLYVEELSKRLRQEKSQSSCVVAVEKEMIPVLLAQVPEGKLWISPNTQESVPTLYKEWQITSKRAQRKNWMRRHRKEPTYHTHLPNKPAEIHRVVAVSMASK